MEHKHYSPCVFFNSWQWKDHKTGFLLYGIYRLVNIQGGIFVWKKERKIKYGRRKNRKTESKGDH